MSAKFFSISILVLAVLLIAFPLAAQVDVSTATLRGVVLDPTAAAVPAATVTVTNLERGFSKTVVTGDDGSYQIPLLQPGVYRIEVVQEGFEKAVASTSRADHRADRGVRYPPGPRLGVRRDAGHRGRALD